MGNAEYMGPLHRSSARSLSARSNKADGKRKRQNGSVRSSSGRVSKECSQASKKRDAHKMRGVESCMLIAGQASEPVATKTSDGASISCSVDADDCKSDARSRESSVDGLTSRTVNGFEDGFYQMSPRRRSTRRPT